MTFHNDPREPEHPEGAYVPRQKVYALSHGTGHAWAMASLSRSFGLLIDNVMVFFLLFGLAFFMLIIIMLIGMFILLGSGFGLFLISYGDGSSPPMLTGRPALALLVVFIALSAVMSVIAALSLNAAWYITGGYRPSVAECFRTVNGLRRPVAIMTGFGVIVSVITVGTVMAKLPIVGFNMVLQLATGAVMPVVFLVVLGILHDGRSVGDSYASVKGHMQRNRTQMWILVAIYVVLMGLAILTGGLSMIVGVPLKTIATALMFRQMIGAPYVSIDE